MEDIPHSWQASDDDVSLSIQFRRDSANAFDRRMIIQGQIYSLSDLLSSAYFDTSFWCTGSAHLPELEEIHLSNKSSRGLLDATSD
jgi:hypothetical protein